MSWMTRFAKARVPMAMLLALTACGAGCQSGKDDAPEGRAAEDFLRDDETSAVTRIADRQAAAGARTDASLRAYHFTGAGLNSLGREKLDFILADRGPGDGDADSELVLYVDLEGDAANRQHADARRASVSEYLTSHGGLAEGEFRLESGHNPHNTMSVVSAVPPKDAGEAAPDAGAGDAAAAMLEAVSDMMPKR